MPCTNCYEKVFSEVVAEVSLYCLIEIRWRGIVEKFDSNIVTLKLQTKKKDTHIKKDSGVARKIQYTQ